MVAPKPVADRGAKPAPSILITHTLTLLDGPGGTTVWLLGPARTDGDVLVFFTKRLACRGNLFQRKAVPVVEPASGGSLLGLVQTLAKARARATLAWRGGRIIRPDSSLRFLPEVLCRATP